MLLFSLDIGCAVLNKTRSLDQKNGYGTTKKMRSPKSDQNSVKSGRTKLQMLKNDSCFPLWKNYENHPPKKIRVFLRPWGCNTEHSQGLRFQTFTSSFRNKSEKKDSESRFQDHELSAQILMHIPSLLVLMRLLTSCVSCFPFLGPRAKYKKAWPS